MTTPDHAGKAEASKFFDRVSGDYRDKYSTRSAFHHYFFNERLEKALRGLDLSGKDVLDIGAGTGNLYDHLAQKTSDMRFFATDVSSGMLAQSRIPVAQQYVGHAYQHPFPVRRFDAIFMLGVTTYMEPQELKRNLTFIAGSLKDGGVSVITFTNKHGLDTISRKILKAPLRSLGRKDKVLSSGLRTFYYSKSEAAALLDEQFQVMRWDLLNHTLFPFNLLIPKPSIWLARKLSERRDAPAWLRPLSSDLMVRVTKKQQPGKGNL